MDISNASTRSKGQALRHAAPRRTKQERKERRNELRRQRSQTKMCQDITIPDIQELGEGGSEGVDGDQDDNILIDVYGSRGAGDDTIHPGDEGSSHVEGKTDLPYSPLVESQVDIIERKQKEGVSMELSEHLTRLKGDFMDWRALYSVLFPQFGDQKGCEISILKGLQHPVFHRWGESAHICRRFNAKFEAQRLCQVEDFDFWQRVHLLSGQLNDLVMFVNHWMNSSMQPKHLKGTAPTEKASTFTFRKWLKTMTTEGSIVSRKEKILDGQYSSSLLDVKDSPTSTLSRDSSIHDLESGVADDVNRRVDPGLRSQMLQIGIDPLPYGQDLDIGR